MFKCHDPSIIYTTYSVRGLGGAGICPSSWHWAKSWVHPRQVASLTQCWQTGLFYQQRTSSVLVPKPVLFGHHCTKCLKAYIFGPQHYVPPDMTFFCIHRFSTCPPNSQFQFRSIWHLVLTEERERETDRQPLTFMPLQAPVNLPFLRLWEETEYPEETHSDTGKTCNVLPMKLW